MTTRRYQAIADYLTHAADALQDAADQAEEGDLVIAWTDQIGSVPDIDRVIHAIRTAKIETAPGPALITEQLASLHGQNVIIPVHAPRARPGVLDTPPHGISARWAEVDLSNPRGFRFGVLDDDYCVPR